MIRETLEPLGKHSIEIKQRVVFPKKRGPQNYHVETWLFFPSSLLINKWNYPPHTFQQNLKNYIRLRPPTLMLGKFVANAEQKLNKIELLISQDNDGSANFSRYEYQLKMFCLTYKRALHLETRYINKLSDTKQQQILLNMTELATKILESYRALMRKASIIAQENTLRVLSYCDEYLALITTLYGRKILNHIPASDARDVMRDFWRGQMLYRKQTYPDTFPSPNSDNELVVYRLNILKKYISSPMYLLVCRKQGETFMAHTIAGFAAALAMIFATAVAFFWQGKYGALSTQLFLAMVIGYIFKDRMKEGFRARLFSTFRRWVPDRQQMIYKNLDRLVGRCNESFVFVSEENLPEDVRAIRRQVHQFDIQKYFLSEDILHYSKHVKLWKCHNLFSGFNRSVMDITRLDIMTFLKHTDELVNELPILDDDNVTYGEKTYHINIIRRITDSESTLLERTRIVVTSEGIKRIEPVLSTSTEIGKNNGKKKL